MPNVVVNNRSLQQIAQAIRNKNQSATTYKPHEMSAAIAALPVGVVEVATSAEMDANLASGLIGASYLYTGTTDSKYVNGRIYVIRNEVTPTKYIIDWDGNTTGKQTLDLSPIGMDGITAVKLSSEVPANMSKIVGCTGSLYMEGRGTFTAPLEEFSDSSEWFEHGYILDLFEYAGSLACWVQTQDEEVEEGFIMPAGFWGFLHTSGGMYGYMSHAEWNL